jgi:tetratricopeptide (TPR) repeat protein
MDTDRNLLFGVLCLQVDLIDNSQFAEACAAWAARKDSSLADLLLQRGWITTEDREQVEDLLCCKLRKHAGDVHASLVKAAGADVRRALAALADPDIDRSLAATPCQSDGRIVPPTLATSGAATEDGRYSRLSLHARGGIGQVWKVHDRHLRRTIALKELQPGQNQTTLRSRFLAEARITGQLEHPGVVPVYEMVQPEDGGTPFYTMRFIQGRTLTEAVRDYHERCRQGRAGPVELRELLHAFVMVCNTLAFAHSRGVIHRDLKGSNIILGPYGEVLVLDWGLAKSLDDSDETLEGPPVQLGTIGDDLTTLPGQVMGTPGYMAPEQAEGRIDRIDRRTDVYGLGAVLYETLTGQPPFTGQDAAEVLRRVRQGSPVSPRQLMPDVPRPLEAVCLKALAHRPGDRYQTALELAEEVKRWVAGEPVIAWPEPWPVRVGRWVGRHRTAVTSVAAALLATLLLGGGGWAWWQRHEGARRAEETRAAQERHEKVLAELDRAEDLHRKARAARPGEARGLAAEARAAAERADGLLSGADDEELARQLRALVDNLQEEERDRRMAARLVEAQARKVASFKMTSPAQPSRENNFGLDLDTTAAEQEYAEAFKEYRLDPWTAEIQDTARWIRARPIRSELIAALDDWADLKKGAEARRLRDLARAADDDPERNQIRKAVDKRDAAVLKKLAASEHLKRWPAATLILLAEALRKEKLSAEAEAVLRRAQMQYPDDFVVNLSLASACEGGTPRRAHEVIRFASAAVAVRKDSPVGYVLLALGLSHDGRSAEAAEVARQAVALQPDQAIGHILHGAALYLDGDREGALRALRQAAEMQPGFAFAHQILGVFLRREGRLDEAIAALQKAVALQPNDAAFQNALGEALGDSGRHDDAVRAFKKAIELCPEDPTGHNNLGWAFGEKGRYEQALPPLRKAIELKPDYASAHNNLGWVLGELGRFDEALPPLRKAIELDPEHARAHNNLGWVLNNKGRYDEAIPLLRKAVKLDPRYAKAHGNLGVALSRTGHWEEAAAAFREKIKLKPDSAAYNNLGWALNGAGRYDAALPPLREAIKQDTNNAVAHSNLGWALNGLGHYDEALAACCRALELKPNLAPPCSHLGYALWQKGQTDEALAACRKAIKRDPKVALARDTLGCILQEQGHPAEALEAFREAARLRPFDDQVSAHLCAALLEAGRLTEALAAAKRHHEALPPEDARRKASGERVSRIERLLHFEPQLAAIVQEKALRTDADPALLAELCRCKHRFAASARFWQEAFAANPGLAEDAAKAPRYQAARAALLAASGQGEDAAKLDERERAGWRKQSREWLQAELAWRTRQGDQGKEVARAEVRRMLQHWLHDSALLGVRDGKALDELPAEERVAWQRFWAEVKALLAPARVPG